MDIGSNSIHLTLARIHHDGGPSLPRVEIMATLKDAARLAAYLGPDGNLSPAGIDRAIETLRRYRRVADEHHAEVRAAATAAMRAARNADEVLRRVAESCGVQIQVISGADEARLVYEGVQHGLPELRSERVLCVDVGGGSTELLLGENGVTKLVASVPIGAVVVTQALLADDPLRPRAVAEMRRRLLQRLAPHRGPIAALRFDRAIGTGGSIQRAVRVSRARRTGDMRGDVNGQRLTLVELRQVLDALLGAGSRANRLRIPGIDPERADTLLGGALIFEAVSEALGISQWTVSTAALRLGLLMDTWRRRPTGG
jgi:exopolyphosphatase/guanosine-5'-triphosphate,3'-diphosphate pyrophosphatase